MPPSDLLERLHPSVRETFIPLEGTDITLHLPGDAVAVARDILASLPSRSTTHIQDSTFDEAAEHAAEPA